MKRVLVTGHAGYIGSVLCKMLKESGFYVIGTDHNLPTHKFYDVSFRQDYSRLFDNTKLMSFLFRSIAVLLITFYFSCKSRFNAETYTLHTSSPIHKKSAYASVTGTDSNSTTAISFLSLFPNTLLYCAAADDD